MTPLVIEFEQHGIRFRVGPAFVDLNPVFRAASEALLRPYRLALQMGRVNDEQSLHLLARAYSESVIIEADPEMGREAVYRWLVDHPADFDVIRSFAEHRPNFEEVTDGGAGDGAGGFADSSGGPADGGSDALAE